MAALGWLLAATVAAYALALAGLVVAGRRGEARALARLVPDCAVLAGRLARDRRVPRRWRVALVALGAYLALPVDLVPDVIPVAGALDDAILVGLVLRGLVRAAGPGVVAERWPGPPDGLRLVLRAAGVGSGA
jgi:uncharacterized membrane protein YkvA (DUF1232 family)